jgi:hypothetical protein
MLIKIFEICQNDCTKKTIKIAFIFSLIPGIDGVTGVSIIKLPVFQISSKFVEIEMRV